MKQKLLQAALFSAVFCGVWLLLSYYFFPIKLAACAAVYFVETVRHMAALKFWICLLFSLFSLFVYDCRCKKARKTRNRD